MKVEYALTQVASVTLLRHEIEEMISVNLVNRGGDPSYDFATHRPIFIWDERGTCTIRWVQSAVFAPSGEQWRQLKPVPTRAEIDKLADEKRTKAA